MHHFLDALNRIRRKAVVQDKDATADMAVLMAKACHGDRERQLKTDVGGERHTRTSIGRVCASGRRGGCHHQRTLFER